MSMTSVITALQARHAAISGVKTAPTSAPDVLPDGNCPCVLIDPLDAVTLWNAHAGAVVTTERTYLIRLLVAPISLGKAEQQRALTISILDALIASYQANSTAANGAVIVLDRAPGVRDTGPRPFGASSPVMWGGEPFYGAEIRLIIEERSG